jgi:hypothetical protein
MLLTAAPTNLSPARPAALAIGSKSALPVTRNVADFTDRGVVVINPWSVQPPRGSDAPCSDNS